MKRQRELIGARHGRQNVVGVGRIDVHAVRAQAFEISRSVGLDKVDADAVSSFGRGVHLVRAAVVARAVVHCGHRVVVASLCVGASRLIEVADVVVVHVEANAVAVKAWLRIFTRTIVVDGVLVVVACPLIRAATCILAARAEVARIVQHIGVSIVVARRLIRTTRIDKRHIVLLLKGQGVATCIGNEEFTQNDLERCGCRQHDLVHFVCRIVIAIVRNLQNGLRQSLPFETVDVDGTGGWNFTTIPARQHRRSCVVDDVQFLGCRRSIATSICGREGAVDAVRLGTAAFSHHIGHCDLHTAAVVRGCWQGRRKFIRAAQHHVRQRFEDWRLVVHHRDDLLSSGGVQTWIHGVEGSHHRVVAGTITRDEFFGHFDGDVATIICAIGFTQVSGGKVFTEHSHVFRHKHHWGHRVYNHDDLFP